MTGREFPVRVDRREAARTGGETYTAHLVAIECTVGKQVAGEIGGGDPPLVGVLPEALVAVLQGAVLLVASGFARHQAATLVESGDLQSRRAAVDREQYALGHQVSPHRAITAMLRERLLSIDAHLYRTGSSAAARARTDRAPSR
jgi:hypothetical protein